jgi:hypothetical protein
MERPFGRGTVPDSRHTGIPQIEAQRPNAHLLLKMLQGRIQAGQTGKVTVETIGVEDMKSCWHLS